MPLDLERSELGEGVHDARALDTRHRGAMGSDQYGSAAETTRPKSPLAQAIALSSTTLAAFAAAASTLSNHATSATGRSRAALATAFARASDRAVTLTAPVALLVHSLGEAWGRVRPRLGLKSLYWQIFVANLTGLGVMLIGILILSSQQNWLIEAKRESIQAQAQLISDAIVREATAEDRGFAFPDPDRLLDGGQAGEQRPVNIQDFEFAIQPEKVAPILQRYSQASGQRARIYARDGTIIYDSAGLSNRVVRRDLAPPGEDDTETTTMVQSFWMRLDSILLPSKLPVYREIGRGNGLAYPEVAAAIEGLVTPMLMVNYRGSHMVSVAVPIQRMRAVQGALLLSTRDGEIDGIRRKERHLLTWIFVTALVATALTALLLAGTIGRPMRRLSESALAVKRNIGAAQDLPTFPDHKNEIGQMASAFRDMTLALLKRIELSEKFAADVAHELKNPVTAVRSAAESLTYVKNEDDRKELLQNIQTDLKRLDKLITDISNFSRLDAELSLHEAEPVDIGELANGVAHAFNDMRGTTGNPRPVVAEIARTHLGQEQVFLVSGHEGRLGQVVTNLVDNALSFSPPAGHVWVRVAAHDDAIEVIVDDEGPGIPEGGFDKIFERFYTDRPDSEATQGKNSGLGLSITREIVEAHQGEIHAINRLGPDGAQVLGARFVVSLPMMRKGMSGLKGIAEQSRHRLGMGKGDRDQPSAARRSA